MQGAEQKVLASLGSFDEYVREDMEGASATMLKSRAKGTAPEAAASEVGSESKGWLEVRTPDSTRCHALHARCSSFHQKGTTAQSSPTKKIKITR